MSKIKRFMIGLATIVTLFLSGVAPSLAAGTFSYESEAQVLNDLGLYKGISETQFDPDLGTALNRETGVVMLLRIFGLESKAQAALDSDATLAKFTDAAAISSWAKNAVAYAVKNGLVQGLPDGTFGPKASLNGKAYCTLILRQLGYTPDYNNAPAELADKGGLSVLEAVKFNEKALVRDDLVGISYGSLSAKDIKGKTVISKLIENNIVDEKVAFEVLEVPEVSQTSKPTVAGTINSGAARISGTAEANAAITVNRNESQIGAGTADGSGTYTVELNPGISLAENDQLSITATAHDKSASDALIVTVVAKPEPFIPRNLTAEAGDGKVILKWEPVEGAESYNVKRSTTSGGPYETIKTGVSETSYTDSGLQNGTTYYYVITAVKKVTGEAANN